MPDATKELKAALKKAYRDVSVPHFKTTAEGLEARVEELRAAAKRASASIKTLEKQLDPLL